MGLAILAAEAVYDSYLEPYRIRADGIMLHLNLFLTLVCLSLSPLNGCYSAAFLVSIPLLICSWLVARHFPGRLITRLFMAFGFMAYTGLIIQETHGDIEAHFSAFGLVGALLYYRDWRTIVAATVFIFLHHLLGGVAQHHALPVYVFDSDHYIELFGIHVAYFVPFIVMMIYLSIWLRREGYEDQRVIALAQRIVQGQYLTQETTDGDLAQMPLISAVTSMKNRLLDLLRIMPVAAAVIRIDNEQVVSINDSWRRTLGEFELSECGIGQLPMWTEPGSWNDLLDKLRHSPERCINKVEVLLKKCSGEAFLAELSIILHEDMQPVMAILTLEDISHKRQHELSMQRLAFHDMLTDLPNRTCLYQAMEKAVQEWQQTAVPFAIILLDLDGFKPVNDCYGHDAGDEVLRIIAARIRQINRKDDLAARLGGDEFVILVNDIADTHQVLQVAQRFIQALSRPISLTAAKNTVVVGASAGVAITSAHPVTQEIMLKQADLALYNAKTSGKGRVALYQRPELETH